MKLNDLEAKKYASKALSETYDMNFDVSKLDRSSTYKMLKKIQGLIQESRDSKAFYNNQTSPTYLKLVFMEEALASHYGEIKNRPAARIVLENEEVEKSQVILAAQDMVDSVQKMYEDVNDMLVKELPALTDSIQSEIGANESATFNQQVGEALTTLNSILQQTKTTLQNALGTVTGQGENIDFNMPAGDENVDIDVTEPLPEPEDTGAEETMPEPDSNIAAAVGRAKR